MRPFLRALPVVVAALFAAVAMLAVGFLPLFGGPGYEISLAAGLLLPIPIAIATALEVAVEDGERARVVGSRPFLSRVDVDRPTPHDALARGVANGAAIVAIAYLTTLIHGARAGFCDFVGGSVHFALGPGAGALMAGAWGAFAGEIARSRRRGFRRVTAAVLLGLAAPIATAAVSLVRFYASPMVFAYDPFVGFFSGSFYDTVISWNGLITYRAGSGATLFAAFVAAAHLRHERDGRLVFKSIGRPGVLVAGVAALAASVAMNVLGSKLGHWQTPETIAAELGARIKADRCDVVYPRSMKLADAQRFARECDAYVEYGERFFEVKEPARIKAYLFVDAAQKGELMGAADTFIAKPWRDEVYVQAAGYPHPVVGHEIMHVIAGRFGEGPFKIAGRLGGLIPNPGLIEGVAVAAEPRSGDLMPNEWAKAMKDLGLLPKLEKLFAFGFLGENSSIAYTVSGAFVTQVKDRYGVATLKAWYGGGDLAKLTGKSWSLLEDEFTSELDRVKLSPAALAAAKARFDRPAIFERKCPHTIDGCRKKASELQAKGDEDGAAALWRKIIDLDRGDASARINLATTSFRRGDLEEGTKELEAIANDAGVTRAQRDRALEQLGDRALADDDGDRAIARYREVASRSVDEDVLRTLDLKMLAAKDERARAAMVALLVGEKGRPPDRFAAAELLAVWAKSQPNDGTPLYLLGRQYANAGEYDRAAARLDRAVADEIASPRVALEARRLRFVVACATGDVETAKATELVYISSPGVNEARREAATELLDRCRR